jgi:hypothetical protein
MSTYQEQAPPSGGAIQPSIPRREAPSREEFVRDYLEPNLPVIITGALTGWRAMSRWNLDFFKASYASTEVEIDGQTYTMKSFIELVEQSRGGRVAPYLRNQILGQLFPELLEDLKPLPAYFRPNWLAGPFFPSKGSEIELYIGGTEGSFPYLHYDGNGYYAFLCQILGRKEFLAYAPDQTPYLYPRPGHHRNHSQIENCQHPDLQKFPMFARAKGFTSHLDPGEILFIPAGWWHTARMLTASITVSMNTANGFNWKRVTDDICFKAGLKAPLLPTALRGYLGMVGLFKSLCDQFL